MDIERPSESLRNQPIAVSSFYEGRGIGSALILVAGNPFGTVSADSSSGLDSVFQTHPYSHPINYETFFILANLCSKHYTYRQFLQNIFFLSRLFSRISSTDHISSYYSSYYMQTQTNSLRNHSNSQVGTALTVIGWGERHILKLQLEMHFKSRLVM